MPNSIKEPTFPLCTVLPILQSQSGCNFWVTKDNPWRSAALKGRWSSSAWCLLHKHTNSLEEALSCNYATSGLLMMLCCGLYASYRCRPYNWGGTFTGCYQCRWSFGVELPSWKRIISNPLGDARNQHNSLMAVEDLTIHEWINTTLLPIWNFPVIAKRPLLPPLSVALCNCSDGEQSRTVDGAYFCARAVPSLLWSDSNLMLWFGLHLKQLKLMMWQTINSGSTDMKCSHRHVLIQTKKKNVHFKIMNFEWIFFFFFFA